MTPEPHLEPQLEPQPELQLGLTPWLLGQTLDADSLCSQAERAEDWGYDAFFLPETHFVDNAPLPDPMLLLAAIAGRTSRLRLGTTSYLLPIRHPLLAAEQVASLDQLCGGRLILGLGRGYQPGMLNAFGVNSADKRTLFGDALSQMRSAWQGLPVGAAEHAQTLSPLPAQRPHPPLWVAGFGPKALEQIGRLGLPYLASPMESLDELESNFNRLGEALAAHDHPPPSTVPIMRTVFVSEDRRTLGEVRDRLAATAAPVFRKGEQPAVEDCCLLGTADEVKEQLAHYRKRLGMTHMIAVRPRVGGINSEWLENSFALLSTIRR